MAIPLYTTGSLSPTFVPAPPVGVAVKLPSAFALFEWFPTNSEGTFERLRYPFGGDRPSQTPRQTLSHCRVTADRLEIQHGKGGIPTATPVQLTSYLLSLPPILYIPCRIPVSNWSKAPWGLSVLAQVTSIFTGISISPGVLLRQCPNHSAFRAGRNLPDKECRYLMTVIVTAAVYWGLNSKLRLR